MEELTEQLYRDPSDDTPEEPTPSIPPGMQWIIDGAINRAKLQELVQAIQTLVRGSFAQGPGRLTRTRVHNEYRAEQFYRDQFPHLKQLPPVDINETNAKSIERREARELKLALRRLKKQAKLGKPFYINEGYIKDKM